MLDLLRQALVVAFGVGVAVVSDELVEYLPHCHLAVVGIQHGLHARQQVPCLSLWPIWFYLRRAHESSFRQPNTPGRREAPDFFHRRHLNTVQRVAVQRNPHNAEEIVSRWP